MGVHRQVDLPVEALHVDRVPVLVVQQAAHRDGNAAVAAAEPLPVVICGRQQEEEKWGEERGDQIKGGISDASPAGVRRRGKCGRNRDEAVQRQQEKK